MKDSLKSETQSIAKLSKKRPHVVKEKSKKKANGNHFDKIRNSKVSTLTPKGTTYLPRVAKIPMAALIFVPGKSTRRTDEFLFAYRTGQNSAFLKLQMDF